MNDNFLRGLWWAYLLRSREVNVPQVGGGNPIMAVAGVLMLIPLVLEILLVGALSFNTVSAQPTDLGFGLPAWLGWIAAVVTGLLYLGLNSWWPAALVLAAIWTPAYALLFHKADVRTFEPISFLSTLFREGWDAAAILVAGHSWKWAIIAGLIVFFGRIAFVAGANRRRA